MISEVDIKYIDCYLFSRYWEDSDISLNESEYEEVKEDGSNLPKSMFLPYNPEITSYKGFKDDYCFYMRIDPETGKILNWEQGYSMKIHWKVVDQGIYKYIDNNDNIVANLDCEYVPDYLAIEDSGYGDYVIMNIDKDGNILNWNKINFSETFKQLMEDIVDKYEY